ncbi:MAG: DUF748 domain-containing protein [Gemmataceae bacterium]|nr:DUF748 domain-containing protein [Gemmataceae bacterium]MDW8265264.1 DUF748 domain-containing protein [Gemmataceae bacterium]
MWLRHNFGRGFGRPSWKWGACLVGLALLLLAGPTLIARSPILPWLVRRAVADVPGHIRWKHVTLSWWKPIEVRDAELHDETGQPILRVARLWTDKTLLELLCDRRELGTMHLDAPELHCVCRGASSNLEQAFAPLVAARSEAAGRPARELGVALQIEVSNGTIVFHDADTRVSETLTGIALSARLGGARLAEAQAHGGIASRGTGHWQLELVIPSAEAGKASVLTRDIPLALLAPWARRIEPITRLEGTLTTRLELAWVRTPTGTWDLFLESDTVVDRLLVAAPRLHAERIALNRLELPCRVRFRNDQVHIEEAHCCCDAGAATLRNWVWSSDLRQALIHPGYQATMDVDLARLSALAPELFHLRPGTQLTDGRLTVDVRSRGAGGGPGGGGGVRVGGVPGGGGGQPVGWGVFWAGGFVPGRVVV